LRLKVYSLKMCRRVPAGLRRLQPFNTLMFSDQLFSDSLQNHSSSGTAICVGCLSI